VSKYLSAKDHQCYHGLVRGLHVRKITVSGIPNRLKLLCPFLSFIFNYQYGRQPPVGTSAGTKLEKVLNLGFRKRSYSSVKRKA